MEGQVWSVSDFVGALNQTLEYAYPSVVIEGELANFRVSKNRWVYFDLKDDASSVKFFGTVYGLPGPLEDGMMLQVRGTPRLHQLYGFSVNFQLIRPVGEGTLKRAAALLQAKLTAEGLFDDGRKRTLPYPPGRIGLIASSESAAYHDFMKIINARWVGLEVSLADVQVQGESAPAQIVAAIEHFNAHEQPVDVLVLTRGGGSPEDLAAFSTESVTRAVAASRIPTMVAVGHEVDISLAELAADRRASTPSNAAELLVPDKRQIASALDTSRQNMSAAAEAMLKAARSRLAGAADLLHSASRNNLKRHAHDLHLKRQVLEAYDPAAALRRGYAIVRSDGQTLRSGKGLKPGMPLTIRLTDAEVDTKVSRVRLQ